MINFYSQLFYIMQEKILRNNYQARAINNGCALIFYLLKVAMDTLLLIWIKNQKRKQELR